MTEKLDAAHIGAALDAPTRARLRIEVLAETPSTNAELLARSRMGSAIHGTALLAEQQSAGRGRRGREWISPPGGNLYLSLGWRCEAASFEGFSLAIGLAIVRALREDCSVAAQLKWPNDVQVEGRKLGGILVEVAGEAGTPLDVVIGVGLNLALPAAEASAISQPWTDLQTVLGHAVARNRLAAAVLAQLVDAIEAFLRAGFAPLAAEWNGVDALRGRDVLVSGAGADLSGRCEGVDERGALLLRTGAMLHAVTAGDVTVRTSA